MKKQNKKLLHQQNRKPRSFLAVAQSLQHRQTRSHLKQFNTNPSVVISSSSTSETKVQTITSSSSSLRRHCNFQPFPNRFYNWNYKTKRSLREIVVRRRGEVSFSERRFNSSLRLPVSTAIANRRKNDWILKNRIFNSKTPFWHLDVDQLVIGDESKEDSRGEVQFVLREKFQGKDDKFRCNRNNGYKRNDRRNNGCDDGKQMYLGNSEKLIHGKPWLFSRNEKKFRAQNRLAELGL